MNLLQAKALYLCWLYQSNMMCVLIDISFVGTIASADVCLTCCFFRFDVRPEFQRIFRNAWDNKHTILIKYCNLVFFANSWPLRSIAIIPHTKNQACTPRYQALCAGSALAVVRLTHSQACPSSSPQGPPKASSLFWLCLHNEFP